MYSWERKKNYSDDDDDDDDYDRLRRTVIIKYLLYKYIYIYFFHKFNYEWLNDILINCNIEKQKNIYIILNYTFINTIDLLLL